MESRASHTHHHAGKLPHSTLPHKSLPPSQTKHCEPPVQIAASTLPHKSLLAPSRTHHCYAYCTRLTVVCTHRPRGHLAASHAGHWKPPMRIAATLPYKPLPAPSHTDHRRCAPHRPASHTRPSIETRRSRTECVPCAPLPGHAGHPSCEPRATGNTGEVLTKTRPRVCQTGVAKRGRGAGI